MTERDLALAQGRAALAALGKFNHPETRWFADQLDHYAAHGDAPGLGRGPEPANADPPPAPAATASGRPGPGPLGMAVSTGWDKRGIKGVRNECRGLKV